MRSMVEGASADEQASRPRPLPPRYARSPFPASRGRISAAPLPLPKPAGIGTTPIWPDASSMSSSRSRSIGPIPIGCPRSLSSRPGDIVSVPLGAREATAVVWAENPKPNPRLDNRLKDVEEKLDLPPLKPELRQFVDWVANYTVASRGMVLRMCLRMGEHLGAERERVGVRLAGSAAAAHDRGARARARSSSPTAWCAAKARPRAKPASQPA